MERPLLPFLKKFIHFNNIMQIQEWASDALYRGGFPGKRVVFAGDSNILIFL
jgi:hypothetical protein